MDTVSPADERTDAILTVRLNQGVKEKATKILQSKSLTPSAAVQSFFDVIVKTGEVPYLQEQRHPAPEEIQLRLDAMSSFHTKASSTLSDDAIRAARIKERYDIDLG